MNSKEQVIKIVDRFNERVDVAFNKLNELKIDRSDYIERHKELFAPVKVGQQIMYYPGSGGGWGKVEVQRFDCECFPNRWNVRVKLVDIPGARKQEGALLWITITDGGSDWKTIGE